MGCCFMENANFLIRSLEQQSWLPVIHELNKHGCEVQQVVRSLEKTLKFKDITVVLSGTFLNPLAMPGRRILVCHSKEWGKLWNTIYHPMLRQYYDDLVIIDKTPLNRIPDRIRGAIEAQEPGNKN